MAAHPVGFFSRGVIFLETQTRSKLVELYIKLYSGKKQKRKANGTSKKNLNSADVEMDDL